MTSTPEPSSITAGPRRRSPRSRRGLRCGVLVLAVLAPCAAALPAPPAAFARAPVGGQTIVHPVDPAGGTPAPPAWLPRDAITLPGGLILPPALAAPGGLVLPPSSDPVPTASVISSVTTTTDYVAPVPDPVVRARFDAPQARWSAGHRGVDLDAPADSPVRSPGAGVVIYAATVVDRGVVTVRHPDGLRSSLEPVAAHVDVGTVVAAGDALGLVQEAPATTHCEPRCLHWGVRDGQTYLDPLSLLTTEPVVLLPLGAANDR